MVEVSMAQRAPLEEAMKKMTIEERIAVLRDESGEAGDLKMVAICDRALGGSRRARRECARVLDAAQAMGD